MSYPYQTPLRYQSFTSTPTNQQQQSAPLALKTPFSQLDVQTRTVIENIQNAINEEAECSERLAQFTQTKIDDNRADIDLLFERVNTLDNEIHAFNSNANSVKSTVDNSLCHVEAALRTVQRLKFHYTQGITEIPDPYFWQLILEFETRMKEYRSTIAEIDKYVSSSTSQQYTPKMLKEIIQNQYNFFVSLTAQVSKLNDQVDDMKDNFLLYRRKFFEDSTEPFEYAKKKEKSHSFQPQRKISTQVQQIQQPQPGQMPASGFSFGSGQMSGSGFNYGSGISATGFNYMSTPSNFSFSSSQTAGGGNAPFSYSFGSTPAGGGFFGASSAAAGGGFSFGLAGGSSGPSTTPFNFGSMSSAAASGGGFTFGASSAAAAGGFMFGSSSSASFSSTGGIAPIHPASIF